MDTKELTNKEMHDMIHNVLHHSGDSKLIRNILEAMDNRNYKDVFRAYEKEIISFNNQFNNN